MRCRKARSLFSAYLEKDISTALNSLLERHMQGCAECSRAYRLFQKMPQLLHGLREEPQDNRFTQEVLQQIERLQRYPKSAGLLGWRTTVLRPSFAFAVLVTVLLGGMFLLSTDTVFWNPGPGTSDVALNESEHSPARLRGPGFPERSQPEVIPTASARGQLQKEIQDTWKLLQAYQEEQSKLIYLGGSPTVDLVIDLGSLMRQDTLRRQRARSGNVTTAGLKDTY